MTDGMLKRRIAFAEGFAHAGGLKHGIVTESAAAPGRPYHLTGDRPLEHFDMAVGPPQSERADEGGRSVGGRIGAVKEGDEVVGNETRVKVVKNKVSPPFRQAEFQIMYGCGIYHMGEVIDWGVKLNLIDKSGAWYAYKGDKIGQGKANASRFLEENPALAKEIEDQIRHQMMGVPLAVVDTEVGEGPSESSAEPDVGGVAESS